MTPAEALKLVVEWGFVFVIGCVFVGFGITFIRDAFKGE